MNWPKYFVLGRNEGNKAHSNYDSGLFIDDGLIDDMGNTTNINFQPRDVNFLLNYYLGNYASQMPLGDVEKLIRNGQPVAAIVKDFVGYKVVSTINSIHFNSILSTLSKNFVNDFSFSLLF
jgi:hypothetical protein